MKRNTQFKIINVVFIVFLLSLTYLLFFKGGKSSDVTLSKKQTENVSLNLKSEEEVQSIKQSDESLVDEEVSTSKVISNSDTKITAFNSLQIQKINEFKDLHSKVLLTKQEKENLKKLISDRQFIIELGDIYQQSIASDYFVQPHLHAAVNDYLLQALKNGDHETSLAVIKSIILDKQIEDKNRSISEKQVLAENKAELLFHATALYPEEFNFSSSDLPGPVTQKIYENVKLIHKENEELSRAEFIKLSQK